MLRTLLRHDRIVGLAALAAVAAIAWGWLLLGAGMHGMVRSAAMPMAPSWTAGYAATVFMMWASMMLAMMLPSAAPAMLLVSSLMRGRGDHRVLGPTGLFVLGYILVWIGFSLVVTAAQWGLWKAGLLSAGMASSDVRLSGLLLVATGVYQWTQFKRVCLDGCRSPAEALTRYWRRGSVGPILSGAWNGVYCLGCCWLLMSLLFVGGLMNLFWIVGIALLVLIEKGLPFGIHIGRLIGAGLVAWGVLVLFA